MGSGGASFVDAGLGAIYALDVIDIKLKNGKYLERGAIALPSIIPDIEGIEIRNEKSS
jgi:hypothetical protein